MNRSTLVLVFGCISALVPVLSWQTVSKPALVADWNVTEHVPLEKITRSTRQTQL